MNRIFCLFALLLTAPLRLSVCHAAQPTKPNIVLILADDMGFSDLGCFGSEIHTPNLDKLAANGLRFTRFYNMSRCCPSRAALLTGLYSHQAGIGDMTKDQGIPAYQGYLNNKCVTIPEVLKNNGYATAIAGKWHLGGEQFVVTPWMRGFDHGISSIRGGFYYPKAHSDGKKNGSQGSLWIDGINLPDNSPELPKDWYTTDLYADYGIKYIDKAISSEKPFFLYLPFNAPHWPLMAPAEDIQKYRGNYLAGWDKLREQRYRKQIELGIIDPTWPLSPLPKGQPSTHDIPPWDTLKSAEKERLDEIMAVYAACVDHLDQAVGKIVNHLSRNGLLDNTLILFLSDNGGCHEGGALGNLVEAKRASGGPHGPVAHCGQAWATLQNTPFRYYKHWQHEGGIASPCIAHWPAGIKQPGSLCKDRAHLIDIMATCVEISGATYPGEYHGQPVLPLEGVSLLPAFSGGKVEHEAIYWEHEGNTAIIEGDWKLVRVKGEPLELYNITKDRTESQNLAPSHPEKVKELDEKWTAWAMRTGALPKPSSKKAG